MVIDNPDLRILNQLLIGLSFLFSIAWEFINGNNESLLLKSLLSILLYEKEMIK